MAPRRSGLENSINITITACPLFHRHFQRFSPLISLLESYSVPPVVLKNSAGLGDVAPTTRHQCEDTVKSLHSALSDIYAVARQGGRAQVGLKSMVNLPNPNGQLAADVILQALSEYYVYFRESLNISITPANRLRSRSLSPSLSPPSDFRRAIPTITFRLSTSSVPSDSAVQIMVAIWAAYNECNVCMCSEGAFPRRGVSWTAGGGGGRG